MRKGVSRTTTPVRDGLTLLETVLAMLLSVLLIAALQIYGLAAVMTATYAVLLVIGLTVLWALAYLRAPDLTMNASVLLMIAVITLSWVPGRLLEMRETSRRQTVVNHMRRLGQAIQGLEDTGRPDAFEQYLQQQPGAEEAEATMRRAVREATGNQ